MECRYRRYKKKIIPITLMRRIGESRVGTSPHSTAHKDFCIGQVAPPIVSKTSGSNYFSKSLVKNLQNPGPRKTPPGTPQNTPSPPLLGKKTGLKHTFFSLFYFLQLLNFLTFFVKFYNFFAASVKIVKI